MSLQQLVLVSNNNNLGQHALQPGHPLVSPNAAAHDLLASASSPLAPCVYIALQCPRCNEIRQALNVAPVSGSVPCPECGTNSKFILLGVGLTRAQLPFHENYSRERMRWVLRELVTVDGACSFVLQRPRSSQRGLSCSVRSGFSQERRWLCQTACNHF